MVVVVDLDQQLAVVVAHCHVAVHELLVAVVELAQPLLVVVELAQPLWVVVELARPLQVEVVVELAQPLRVVVDRLVAVHVSIGHQT